MSFVAGTTTIPMAAGLVTAVALFLAWSVYVVRGQRAEVVEPAAEAPTSVAPAPVAPAPVRTAPAAPVRVVLRPHYSVAAPDTDAVLTAMAHRVSAPLSFPAPGRRDRSAAPQSLPRSA